jgi:hypothetical protein
MRIAMSAVVIIGGDFFDGSWASGNHVSSGHVLGVHCQAPAGLLVSSHS